MNPRPAIERHAFLFWTFLAGPPGAAILVAATKFDPLISMGRPSLTWIVMLQALVLAPVLEELVFRGGLQEVLERSRWGRLHACGLSLGNVVTSLAFVGLHVVSMSPVLAGATFVPSLVFGRLKQLYDPSLRPSMAMHAWFNLCYLTAAWATSGIP